MNKKGMTLMEMMVVVIVIAAMLAMAYPTYMSAIEKARAMEAVKIMGHLVAAQDKFKGECYSMDSGHSCQYATSFNKLPVEISGKGKTEGGATVVSSDGKTATTVNFVYTISSTALLATPRSTSYAYTISANYADDVIYCNITGTQGSNTFNSGKKICSAIGTKTTNASKYKID